jgi:uncharacterized protein (TIGR02246 family)
MIVRDPDRFHPTWADTFNSGDVDAILALYAPSALLVAEPGHVVAGKPDIRSALVGLLALKPTIELHPRRVLRSGDAALLYSEWRIGGTAQDGSAVSLSGQTTDLVMRQPDGRWLVAIDNPFGWNGV